MANGAVGASRKFLAGVGWGVVGALHPQYPALREIVRDSSPWLAALLPEQDSVIGLVAAAQNATIQLAGALQAQVELLLAQLQQPSATASSAAAHGGNEL